MATTMSRSLVFGSVAAGLLHNAAALAPAPLAPTPPMGWMSWQVFRCEVDCTTYPNACINEALYKGQADALVAGGYLDAGYNGIHIDDCWSSQNPMRNPSNGQLMANATRFPSGMPALAQYMHAKGINFGLYTAEAPLTCGSYPGSAGYEALDANTFASWGVDYLKVDGCNFNISYYPVGYPSLGAALQKTGRNITYSCSWPAYLGNNETAKPFQDFLNAGCNLWRNWHDVQCDWSSVVSIIDHWGDYSASLAQWGTHNHWNDADMLVVGAGCLTDDEARSQMAIWSIIASPLIMGNDLRNVSASQRDVLINKEAIAVNQDPAGQEGGRVGPRAGTEVWARNLADNSVAVALLNKNPFANINATCAAWNTTTDGYYSPSGSGGIIECYSNADTTILQQQCCENPYCAGFYVSVDIGVQGCFVYSMNGPYVPRLGFYGYAKPNFVPPPSPPSPTEFLANITVKFSDVGLTGAVRVRDIWAQQDVGVYTGSYTATDVPLHGNAFLRLIPQ